MKGRSWPRLIHRFVYELVILIVVLGAAAIGFLSWHFGESAGRQILANDYHLASKTHFLKARAELHHLSSHMQHDWTAENSDTEAPVFAEEMEHEYRGAVSYHLILREIRSGLELQRTFADKRFDSLNRRLEGLLVTFGNDSKEYLLNSTVSTEAFSALRRLSTIIDQAVRLHAVLRDELVAENDAREERQALVLFFFVAAVFVIAVLVTRRGLGAINTVISQQQESEKALKASEEKFRSIFQSAAVGMIIGVDGKGVIIHWNLGAERTFGYTQEEAVGQPLTMLMPQRSREAHLKGLARAVKQGHLSHPGATHQLVGLRKNGEEFPLELTLGSWEWQGKQNYSAIVLDITERKQTELNLRRAQKMEAVGQLTGGIAHDLNNILGIVLGNLSLLEMDMAAGSESLEYLDSAQKAVDRAAALIKQLLSFSRRRAAPGKPTDIRRIIQEMESLIARTVTPEVEICHLFADSLWLTSIDPGGFEDTILNLVLNARDAMPNGGSLVLEIVNQHLDAADCSPHPGLTPGDYVVLSVTDTGEGISVQQQEHIFEPFFTTKPLGKGTGLGLSMVYGFVERSSGSILVDSVPGEGATFRVFLPRSEQLEEQPAGEPEQVTGTPRGSETVLVVDDEPELLKLAQRSLKALGYRVLVADNGSHALELLAKEPSIELLFSDILMPGGINGFELAVLATSCKPDLKVLLTTGHGDKMVASQSEARFSANSIGKPYELIELAHHVRALLDTLEQSDDADALQRSGTDVAHRAVEWTEAFAIGIEGLDSDHQVLVALLNRCWQAVQESNQKEAANILNDLLYYTQTHFRREEAVMASCACPGFDNHRNVHQMLADHVAKMKRQLERGALSPDELASFLANWLTDHIQGMDRVAAVYCRRQPEVIAEALRRAGPGPELAKTLSADGAGIQN